MQNNSKPDKKYWSFEKTVNRGLLKLQIWRVGDDFQVLLTGGKAHIGAVAVAVCYGTEKESCNVSQIAVHGHREDSLAAKLARQMAKALRTTVAFSAGIHFDDLTPVELDEILIAAPRLVDKAIKKVSASTRAKL